MPPRCQSFLDSQLVPDQGTILSTSLAFQEFLKIRKSTDLFRLPTAAAINGCVSFPDQGAQIHGLIVEQISGERCMPHDLWIPECGRVVQRQHYGPVLFDRRVCQCDERNRCRTGLLCIRYRWRVRTLSCKAAGTLPPRPALERLRFLHEPRACSCSTIRVGGWPSGARADGQPLIQPTDRQLRRARLISDGQAQHVVLRAEFSRHLAVSQNGARRSAPAMHADRQFVPPRADTCRSCHQNQCRCHWQ
jgi:hypothetical protein